MNIIFSIPVLFVMFGFILTLNQKKFDPFWRNSLGRFAKHPIKREKRSIRVRHIDGTITYIKGNYAS